MTVRGRHVLRWAVGAVLCVAALERPAAAQDGARVYEEQLRVRMDQQAPQARKVGLDAGGWFDVALFDFDDNTGGDKTLRQYALRPWARLDLNGVHTVYVRGLFEINDWNSGDKPDNMAADDPFLHQLDRAWYQFDLTKLIQQNNEGRRPLAGAKVRVGRDYATIGSGLVLSMPLDMVQVEAYAGPWELKALLGKTIWHSNNVDRSAAVGDHQDRCFWGSQVTYAGFDGHRPFAYFLTQKDHTDESPDQFFQNYSYDSSYVGAGSTGNLIRRDLRYQAELVGEFGSTYSAFQRQDKDNICAMAFDGLLEYLFRCDTSPKVTAEYIYGSGDSNRSSLSTDSGNRPGTRDRTFQAFGFRDTGIAFAPQIGNLHTYVLGASFFPLEHIDFFRKMEVGSKVFFYQKAAAGGAISDSAGGADARWVGWEWDGYINWRISSDVSWTIRYGAFQPGDAFATEDQCRQFLYTGLSYSF